MKISLFRLMLGLGLISGAAEAQVAGAGGPALGVQNFDISLLCTVNRVPPLPIAGSDVTVYGHTAAVCASQVFGYQFARLSAVSLWAELAPSYYGGGAAGNVSSRFDIHTLGLRAMVPLHHRIAIYGALGGGGGTFHTFQLVETPIASITDRSILHGVFDFGGGADVRLSRRFSIRGEVRDFVTGIRLSGIAGRNHVLSSIGASFHF